MLKVRTISLFHDKRGYALGSIEGRVQAFVFLEIAFFFQLFFFTGEAAIDLNTRMLVLQHTNTSTLIHEH